MSLMSLAMKDTMMLEKFSKYNYDGTAQHNTAEPKKCYIEKEIKKIVGASGEEVISKATYYTLEPLDVLDKIDGDFLLNTSELNFGEHYYIGYV